MLSVSSIKTDRIRILGENIYVLLSVSSVKTDRIRILGGETKYLKIYHIEGEYKWRGR